MMKKYAILTAALMCSNALFAFSMPEMPAMPFTTSSCDGSALTIVNNTNHEMTVGSVRDNAWQKPWNESYWIGGRLRGLEYDQKIPAHSQVTAKAYAVYNSGGDVKQNIKLQGPENMTVDIDVKFETVWFGYGICEPKLDIIPHGVAATGASVSGKPATATVTIG